MFTFFHFSSALSKRVFVTVERGIFAIGLCRVKILLQYNYGGPIIFYEIVPNFPIIGF